MNIIEAYDKLAAYNRDVFVKKNTDYGNSFVESVKEWGIVAGIVRIDDKMRRIKSLYKKGALVEETMVDTLLDQANYCIMLAACMDDGKLEELPEGKIVEPLYEGEDID